jgi:hypothetical protein
LTAILKNKREMAIQFRTILALQFVPEEFVIEASESLEVNARLNPILEYWHDIYIGTTIVVNGIRRRRTSRYPIPLWNQFNRVESGQLRTNNAVEGWNNAIQSILPHAHPSLWRLAEALSQQLRIRWAEYVQHRAGALRPNKRKYVHVTRRLEIVCRRAYGDHYAS